MGTAKKIVTGGFVLIGVYLAVYYWTGFSRDTAAATTGGATLVRAFQGR